MAEKYSIQVYSHNVLPVRELDVDRLLRLTPNACIVDADVYSAELLDCLVDGGVDGVFSSGIKFQIDDLEVSVRFPELSSCFFESGWFYVAESKLTDSMAGEGVRCILADAWGQLSMAQRISRLAGRT